MRFSFERLRGEAQIFFVVFYFTFFVCNSHKLVELNFQIPRKKFCLFRSYERKTRSICHFHTLLSLLRSLRDCVHYLPKLNMARRNLRRHRSGLYLNVGILVTDESRAQTTVAKDSRSGNGHAVKPIAKVLLLTSIMNSPRIRQTTNLFDQLASFC